MLTAKYKDELINCYDGILRKEVLKQYHRDGMLFCPVCDAPYMYCHGDVNTPYFKHKNSTECTRFSEPESPEHFKGKVALYNWIKGMDGVTNARLEHWIPATNQRPDIAFRYNDDPYVIEYQCTPISGEYRERHKLYSELDITDIWICGTEKYFDKEGCDSSFREKELERRTRYYFDSENGIFILAKEYWEIQESVILQHLLAIQNEMYRYSPNADYYYVDHRERIVNQNLVFQQDCKRTDRCLFFTNLKQVAFNGQPYIEQYLNLKNIID